MKKYICKRCGKEGESKRGKKYCEECVKAIHRGKSLEYNRKKYQQKNIVNGINKTRNCQITITDGAWKELEDEANKHNIKLNGYYTRKHLIFLNNSERIICGETISDLLQKIRE